MARAGRWHRLPIEVAVGAVLVAGVGAGLLLRGDGTTDRRSTEPVETTSTTAATSTPVASSTAVPSTAVPSTAVPSTAVPSTAVPSTAVPPTAVPSTAVPSTAVPPTAVPSTAVPPATVPAPPTPVPAVAVHAGAPDDPRVALTFDAGSDLGYAEEILDLLASNGITASFGITGRWAEEHPAVVARIAAQGHLVINHSQDHPSFTGASTGAAPLTRAERLDQLSRADAAIRAATGASTVPWFRPPYGDQDASVRADAGSAGYGYLVMWSVDSLGWKGLPPAEVARRCLDGAEPGAILLLHVGSESTDRDALPAVIDGVRARGLGFATVAELVG